MRLTPDQLDAQRVNCHKWRAWERRALTLNRRAREIVAELIAEIGLESTVSDHADNVVHATEGLIDALAWAANNSKSAGRSTAA